MEAVSVAGLLSEGKTLIFSSGMKYSPNLFPRVN